MDDHNVSGNKRSAEMNSYGLHSPKKAQKISWNVERNPSSSQAAFSTTMKNSTSSINSKLNNVAKLREQFVKEIEDIEMEMEKTIKYYKLKISKSKTEVEQISEKLKEFNQILCHQSEQIYTKEQENKILGEKVQELYEYQKIIYETSDDISNTLSVHENLTNELANHYDKALIMLSNDQKYLEEKLSKLSPNKEYCKQLEDLDEKIFQAEQQTLQHQNEINRLKIELEDAKRKEQSKNQQVKELDEKIEQLETKKKKLRVNENQFTNQMINENTKLKEECDQGAINLSKLEENISDLKNKLEAISKQENEAEANLKRKKQDIEQLKKEDEDLDKKLSLIQQDNSVAITQKKELLKNLQNELASLKKEEGRKTNIIQTKINDYRDKLKSYERIQQKLKKTEAEKKNEEELVNKLIKESETMKKTSNDKLQKTNENTNLIKEKIKKYEENILESDSTITLLEKEIDNLNIKIEARIKINKENAERRSLTDKFKQYDFEKMFSTKPAEDQEKLKNKQKLYTPTLADDDLDIDKLSLDEQFTQLTQLSQSGSPNKARKFFKSSNLSQSKTRKESTRGRGKAKKPVSTF